MEVRTPASSAVAGHGPRPCEGAAAEVTPWSAEVGVTTAFSPEGVGTAVAAQGVRPAASSDHIVAGASLKDVRCWATADEVAPWASDDVVRTPSKRSPTCATSAPPLLLTPHVLSSERPAFHGATPTASLPIALSGRTSPAGSRNYHGGSGGLRAVTAGHRTGRYGSSIQWPSLRLLPVSSSVRLRVTSCNAYAPGAE